MRDLRRGKNAPNSVVDRCLWRFQDVFGKSVEKDVMFQRDKRLCFSRNGKHGRIHLRRGSEAFPRHGFYVTNVKPHSPGGHIRIFDRFGCKSFGGSFFHNENASLKAARRVV